jgi:hypothetical protein
VLAEHEQVDPAVVEVRRYFGQVLDQPGEKGELGDDEGAALAEVLKASERASRMPCP